MGEGRVVWSAEPEKVLHASGVPPDFVSGQPLRWIHRVDGESEIYFVANPSLRNFNTTASFRVAGKLPELWWPDTGRIEPAPLFQAQDGVTSVSLSFGPNDSVFVVFRKPLPRQSPLLTLVRDGKPVLSARPEPAPRVLIQQASYGLPGDPRQTRDVREKVQQKVDGGQYSFPVRLMVEAGDPAPEKVKTLVVEYRIDGKQYTAQAQDSSTIHLTTNAVKITVEKARYGVLDDPKRTRDVRRKLQALVDAGESSFVVARMAEGDDPAFLVVKTLAVEYSLNGQHRSVKGTDLELIDLNPLAVERTEPVAQARRDPSGKLLVQAFKPGRYEMQFANGKARKFDVPEIAQAVEVTGPWEVRFTPGWGAPAETTFDKLISWPSHSDPSIKYYSGAATYRTSFNLPRTLLKGDRVLCLDLGDVQVMAEVKLNGRNLGLLWKPPFRVELTGAAKAGENKLEVKVVNLWPNRQIGDEQLPEDSERNADGTLKRWPQWLLDGKTSPAGRYTFTSWRLWKKGDALLESGLLGPVRVVVAQQLAVKPSD